MAPDLPTVRRGPPDFRRLRGGAMSRRLKQAAVVFVVVMRLSVQDMETICAAARRAEAHAADGC
jgi:hypothetical protein